MSEPTPEPVGGLAYDVARMLEQNTSPARSALVSELVEVGALGGEGPVVDPNALIVMDAGSVTDLATP